MTENIRPSVSIENLGKATAFSFDITKKIFTYFLDNHFNGEVKIWVEFIPPDKAIEVKLITDFGACKSWVFPDGLRSDSNGKVNFVLPKLPNVQGSGTQYMLMICWKVGLKEYSVVTASFFSYAKMEKELEKSHRHTFTVSSTATFDEAVNQKVFRLGLVVGDSSVEIPNDMTQFIVDDLIASDDKNRHYEIYSVMKKFEEIDISSEVPEACCHTNYKRSSAQTKVQGAKQVAISTLSNKKKKNVKKEKLSFVGAWRVQTIRDANKTAVRPPAMKLVVSMPGWALGAFVGQSESILRMAAREVLQAGAMRGGGLKRLNNADCEYLFQEHLVAEFRRLLEEERCSNTILSGATTSFSQSASPVSDVTNRTKSMSIFQPVPENDTPKPTYKEVVLGASTFGTALLHGQPSTSSIITIEDLAGRFSTSGSDTPRIGSASPSGTKKRSGSAGGSNRDSTSHFSPVGLNIFGDDEDAKNLEEDVCEWSDSEEPSARRLREAGPDVPSVHLPVASASKLSKSASKESFMALADCVGDSAQTGADEETQDWRSVLEEHIHGPQPHRKVVSLAEMFPRPPDSPASSKTFSPNGGVFRKSVSRRGSGTDKMAVDQQEMSLIRKTLTAGQQAPTQEDFMRDPSATQTSSAQFMEPSVVCSEVAPLVAASTSHSSGAYYPLRVEDMDEHSCDFDMLNDGDVSAFCDEEMLRTLCEGK